VRGRLAADSCGVSSGVAPDSLLAPTVKIGDRDR
jgi:hypothetical protein